MVFQVVYSPIVPRGQPEPPTVIATDYPTRDLALEAAFKLIEQEPKYYQEIAEHFGEHEFQAVARAMGRLHAEEKLWQDARGRVCVRGSAFAAKPPGSGDGVMK